MLVLAGNLYRRTYGGIGRYRSLGDVEHVIYIFVDNAEYHVVVLSLVGTDTGVGFHVGSLVDGFFQGLLGRDIAPVGSGEFHEFRCAVSNDWLLVPPLEPFTVAESVILLTRVPSASTGTVSFTVHS